jgi:hypothetical protein
VNGLLAMSELAVVSSRPARLKAMIDRQDPHAHGAASALKLAANPGRFLSTVQIGITLVGVLSGAFSGATLGERLARLRADCTPACRRRRGTLGVGVVVAAITYASLIIGELVPKQIALRDPERVAVAVASGMIRSSPRSPCRWSSCSISGRAVLWLLGQSGASRGKGHRRGDQDARRRGRASRHHRIRRTPHDRRRHAARRPRGARRDDAAHRGRLAQSRMGRSDHRRKPDRKRSIRACRSAKARRQHGRRRPDARPARSALLAGKPYDAAQTCARPHRARSGRCAGRADDAARVRGAGRARP